MQLSRCLRSTSSWKWRAMAMPSSSLINAVLQRSIAHLLTRGVCLNDEEKHLIGFSGMLQGSDQCQKPCRRRLMASMYQSRMLAFTPIPGHLGSVGLVSRERFMATLILHDQRLDGQVEPDLGTVIKVDGSTSLAPCVQAGQERSHVQRHGTGDRLPRLHDPSVQPREQYKAYWGFRPATVQGVAAGRQRSDGGYPTGLLR